MTSYFDYPITETLGGYAIFSRTTYKHLTLVWAHPDPPGSLLPILFSRSRFSEPIFGRYGLIWHYNYPFAGNDSTGHILVVWGNTFSPEKLLTLAKVLCDVYTSSRGSTLEVQKAWQQAFTEGRIGDSWAMEGKYDSAKNFRVTGAKNLLGALGVDAVLVWTALMLRCRVAVLGSNAAEAIKAVRIFPLLMAHRYDAASVAAGNSPTLASPASLMYPYVTLGEGSLSALSSSDEINECDLTGALGNALRLDVEKGAEAQLADLKECGSWVAGFTDPGVLQKGGDLWDICVDLKGKNVVVAETSKSK